ncbi:amidohydrolase family protein [Desulforhabdus sp. TSK]|uniref:amidohydrolase family protein n=1 Tax=Desulforhabdus sp. TSK TaxID=2925014 RepID=UPI001FC872B3|nr:amidohydrolase family protein [Desulforhabdus sp. TSK]GKT08875.1 amidohydrolase [Desulforhabdus sp. TSK]
MEKTFHLLAGHFIDGTGCSIKKQVLLSVRDGSILSLEELRPGDIEGLGKIPFLDFSDCTVLPGLVDAHVHLTMSGTVDPRLREHQLDFSYEEAEQAISKHLFQHLSHGVVAVRDGGDASGYSLRYKLAGTSPSPAPVRYRVAGKAWHAPGRYGRLIGRSPEKGRTLAESITQEPVGPDHIKIVNSGLNSLKQFGKMTPPQFGSAELKAAIAAGLRRGWKTMVHANGDLPVAQALDAGCHSIEHGFFMGRSNLERIRDLRVYWTPTACTMKAYWEQLPSDGVEVDISRRNLDHQMEQISYALRIGAPLTVGTDSGGLGLHHGASIIEELKLFVSAGFSLEGAIQCASSNGAQLLGLDKTLGTLRPGLGATFLVVKGAPSSLLTTLQHPVGVYVDGVPSVENLPDPCDCTV